MARPANPTLAELLNDGRWLRRMAQSLAQSNNEGEDLAQDACLKAIESPPHEGENLRGWFVQVLRNLRRQRHRSDLRRSQREQLMQPIKTQAATFDLVDRAATHRAVLDAVLELHEPYRTTVLLRFFEDLPPRDIAARLEVPVATVNTRMQRAFAQLRRRLDTQFSDRKAWASIVLATPPWQAKATPLWIVIMQGKALASLTVVAIGAALVWLASSPEQLEFAPNTDSAASLPADGRQPFGSIEDTTQPSRIAIVANTNNDPESLAAAGRDLVGRVVNSNGQVCASLRIEYAASGAEATRAIATATSEHDGSFRITTDHMGSGVIESVEPGWLTVCWAAVTASKSSPMHLVIAERRLPITGRVRSADGRALHGAIVRVVWPQDLRARLHDISDRAEVKRIIRECDEQGCFQLVAAQVRGAELLTTAPGFLPDRRPLPSLGQFELAITLQPPSIQDGMVQGMVVDARGRPVAKATVTLGTNVTQTDQRGTFSITDDLDSDSLFASLAGWRMARETREDSGFANFTTLTLQANPLTIRGSVRDDAGHGIAGIKVWVTDPTIICRGDELITCEGVASGCASMVELRERHLLGEAISRNTPMSHWSWVTTDAHGSFLIKGLEQRNYTIRAMDSTTLHVAELPAVAAGSSTVLLEMHADDRIQELRGTLVNGLGAAVVGARVRIQADTQSVGGTTMNAEAKQSTTTDEAGEFRLRNVPRHHAYLRVDGDAILPVEFGRGTAGGLASLVNATSDTIRVVAHERMHVQVELSDPAAADSLRVLDVHGNAMLLNVFKGRSRRETETLALASGRSMVFVVADTAATICLLRAGKEVQRQSLVLQPHTINKLQM